MFVLVYKNYTAYRKCHQICENPTQLHIFKSSLLNIYNLPSQMYKILAWYVICQQL